jgi:hypothetical protein
MEKGWYMYWEKEVIYPRKRKLYLQENERYLAGN